MGLQHDRYTACDDRCHNWPASYSYGYVNQRGFSAGMPESRRWRTIMAYGHQCLEEGVRCALLLRFANPAQTRNGDPLGVAGDLPSHRVDGPADAVRLLNESRHVMASFRDPPANRPPQPDERLRDRTLEAGSVAVDLAGAFWDPDGDALTYGATSSAAAVATVAVSGSRLTLTPVAPGAATVMVTATDLDGSNASTTQAFTVTVTVSTRNRPPEPVGALPPLTIELGDDAVTVEVSGAFRDPDGDVLTYGATSLAPGVASVSVSGSRVRVTPVSAGTSQVAVTAIDVGESNTLATQTFTVTVSPPANRGPEAVGSLPTLTIGLDDDAVTVEVSGAFRDPDGDALTYAAVSSAPTVVSVSVSGSRVRVVPVSAGTSLVTLTATDLGGSDTSVTQTFEVTVVAPFTDHPIVPGETPVRAVHFTELRARVDALRTREGLAAYGWTDPVLTAEVDAGSAGASARVAAGAGGGVWSGGAGGAVLGGCGTVGGGDADPGVAPDGVARRCGGPRVK